MKENPYESPKSPTEEGGRVMPIVVEVFVYLLLAAFMIAMVLPAISL
jgi:hypothetical protein